MASKEGGPIASPSRSMFAKNWMPYVLGNGVFVFWLDGSISDYETRRCYYVKDGYMRFQPMYEHRVALQDVSSVSFVDVDPAGYGSPDYPVIILDMRNGTDRVIISYRDRSTVQPFHKIDHPSDMSGMFNDIKEDVRLCVKPSFPNDEH